MSTDAFETCFNSSARSAGHRLFKEGKVSFSKPSSLEIMAYVKPNYRVGIKLESLQNTVAHAECNCPPSQKGQPCKHIWAACLAVSEKSADFFEGVTEVTKKAAQAKVTTPQSESQTLSKEIYKLKQENFKLKQAMYRKEQYQKQKERAKEFKAGKKKSFKDVQEGPTYPGPVQAAIDYFAKNGFSFEGSLNEASVSLARKKLARVFHPDIGGSHGESLELNSNSQVLLIFISKL